MHIIILTKNPFIDENHKKMQKQFYIGTLMFESNFVFCKLRCWRATET